MKKLSLNEMAELQGGSVAGCAGIVLSGIGIAALFFVAAPVSIAATLWLMTTSTAAGMSMGFSIADCALN